MAKGQSRPRTPNGGGESRSGKKICFSKRVRVRPPPSAPARCCDILNLSEVGVESGLARNFASDSTVQVISLDRGGVFGEAASMTLLDTIQVADRWHLIDSASAAFLIAVRKLTRLNRSFDHRTRQAYCVGPRLFSLATAATFKSALQYAFTWVQRNTSAT